MNILIKSKNIILIVSCLFLLLTAAFNLNGCSCSETKPDGGASTNQPAAGGKSLKLALPSDLTATDPALSSDVTSGQVLSKIFEKLVNLNNDLAIVPELADTFEISADCTEFKFVLKNGVLFSDGKTILNARIVKDSFQRVASPDTVSPRANIFDKIIGYDEFVSKKADAISGITVNGDYEITLKIKEPFAPFLYNLTMVPASITLNDNGRVIGTGPFVFDRKSDGAKLTLAKNTHYHSADKVFIDEIVFKIIHDQMTQISEFELGNIDILNLSTINVNRFVNDANRAKYNIHKQPKLNVYYIAFNFNKNIFSENLRKALNMAINKDELIDSLMKGTMTAARGPFPPSLGAFDPELAGYKYDPAKAKEMLASEKPESLKFDLYYKSSNENEDLMQMIKEDLAKIGVTVNLKKMEWAALKSEIVKGNLPAYYLNWSADFPDAHNFLIPLFHSKNMGAGGNRAFFSDAAADADMNKLESTSNPDEYKKLARKIQKDVVEKAPWIFMWHEIEYAASQKSVEGYDVPKIYSMENFVNVKLNR